MKIINKVTLLLLLVFVTLSCDDDMQAISEAPKNLEGKWKIVRVLRNGVDITEAMDFSQFQMNINEDQTYNFDNYLPFIVKDNGTWSVDDPKYPFKLNFRESSATEDVVTDLTFPIVLGTRQIRLSFSPGCSLNKYDYVLERSGE